MMPASSFVVSFGKALNGVLLSLADGIHPKTVFFDLPYAHCCMV